MAVVSQSDGENDLKLKIKVDLCVWEKIFVMIVRQIWKWEYHTTSFSTVDCYTHSACVWRRHASTWNCRQVYISHVQILDSLQKIVPFTQNRDRWFANGQPNQPTLSSKQIPKQKKKKWTNNIFCVQSCGKRNLGVEKKRFIFFPENVV